MKNRDNMKLSKQEMLKTKFGSAMEQTIKAWDIAIEQKDRKIIEYCGTYWEASKEALYFIYGKEFHFSRDETQCGVIDDDGEWLFKVREQEVQHDKTWLSQVQIHKPQEQEKNQEQQIQSSSIEQPQQEQKTPDDEKPFPLEKLLGYVLHFLRRENTKIAFWKENEKWHIHVFFSMGLRDASKLKSIKGIDKNAVIIDKSDIIVDWKYAILYLDYIASVIEYKHTQSSCPNNIGVFLENYEKKQQEILQQEAQPISPKLDKQHFLQSKAGEAFTHTARLCYFSKKFNLQEEEYWSIAINRLLAILHYCYGVEYCMVMDDDGVTIKTQDDTDVLYTYTEKE